MRKEKTVVLEDGGKQLSFVVRQMPATKLESWIIRVGLLLASSGVAGELLDEHKGDLDVEQVMHAAVTLAGRGVKGLLTALGRLDYDKVKPLLDDLLACCTLKGNIEPLTPEIVDATIEDVRTLFKLQKEALAVNLGFFAIEKPLDSEASGSQGHHTRKREISVRS